ncbi:MAG: 16S rRNA (cytosine(1402)-N(4))-methyltransferase RsmH [Paracoccaceae bacterium]|nr:16S rRNA (cytosine(1402)-N(4))-methyltransferase RsmH [Paracoccaceae bacterium]MDE2915300.1 16S rRNA (cytosine(1402)-N(4))-methyltransferase RsmH [Paracoccaceae bacterium]
MPAVTAARPASGHVPVLLGSFIGAVSPVTGLWIDGTLGGGGYTRALLNHGASRVIAVDRDPLALARAKSWSPVYADRLELVEGDFADVDSLASDLGARLAGGVVLDLGLSSIQLDDPERGFSVNRDGPLDMRMSGKLANGLTAADIVNNASRAKLAEIFRTYGEERAAWRIAGRVVAARALSPIRTTSALARIVADCLPPARRGEIHPATRSFQALRIAVNGELDKLARGLAASASVLEPGGWLAVVSFHSLEDRLVKQFMRSGGTGGGLNRHAPPEPIQERRTSSPESLPPLERVTAKPIVAGPAETAVNPRSRSARLRIARRPFTAAGPADRVPVGQDRARDASRGQRRIEALSVPHVDLTELLR